MADDMLAAGSRVGAGRTLGGSVRGNRSKPAEGFTDVGVGNSLAP